MTERFKGLRANRLPLIFALVAFLLLNVGIVLHLAIGLSAAWMWGAHGAALVCGLLAFLKMR